MTIVILVRHGRTTSNAAGTLSGRLPRVHLDDVGTAAATALGAHLRDVPLDAAVTSPMERCQQTLHLLLGDRPELPVHVEDRINECDYGDWSGQTLSALAKDPGWKIVQAHPAAAVFPNGESLAHMQHRAVSAVRDWNAQLGPDAVYVMVSHGDVIKAILADALGLHLDHFQRIRVDPASVSIVDYSPMRPFVDRMNDAGGGVSTVHRPHGRRKAGSRRRRDAEVGGGAGR